MNGCLSQDWCPIPLCCLQTKVDNIAERDNNLDMNTDLWLRTSLFCSYTQNYCGRIEYIEARNSLTDKRCPQALHFAEQSLHSNIPRNYST